jgi:hypothetical protein
MMGSIVTFTSTFSNRKLLLPVLNYGRKRDRVLKRRLVAMSPVN